MPLRLLAGPMVLVAALTLGGCGSEEPDLPDRLTACEVVGATEMAAALDGPVAAPSESSGAATDQLAGRSGCAWSRRDETAAVLVELVRTDDMARSVRRTGFSAAARFQAVAAAHPTAAAADVGERSLFLEEQSKLWLLEGEDLVIFEVAVSPTTGARPIAVALGIKAVERLQQAD